MLLDKHRGKIVHAFCRSQDVAGRATMMAVDVARRERPRTALAITSPS
jgi:hypothetical protein